VAPDIGLLAVRRHWHQDIKRMMFLCMRTTLTLDPDVAVLVEKARDKTKRPLKEIVNDALRRGLTAEDPKSSPESA
jgi:hypothetical protein